VHVVVSRFVCVFGGEYVGVCRIRDVILSLLESSCLLCRVNFSGSLFGRFWFHCSHNGWHVGEKLNQEEGMCVCVLVCLDLYLCVFVSMFMLLHAVKIRKFVQIKAGGSRYRLCKSFSCVCFSSWSVRTQSCVLVSSDCILLSVF